MTPPEWAAGPWLPLFLLRWVGLGYTQVFWILGTSGVGWASPPGLPPDQRSAWGLVWAYGTVGLVAAAPEIGPWLTLGAMVLLVLSLVAGSWHVYRSRRRTARPEASSPPT